MITAAPLDDLPRLRHAFFTREGGVSRGLYGSLNCGLGSGDRPEAVVENRARAMAMLGRPAEALATAYQVHSSRVAIVAEPWPDAARPQVDALVTDRPGVALGILTADCAPVLFADPEARVIGAAHAGWRGARDGVLEATVAAMRDLGAAPQRIVAAIGPAIGPDSYEVGPEFPEHFRSGPDDAGDLFRPSAREGRFMFDLPRYVARRLERLGVAQIAVTDADTCRDEDRFFSYRRACLRGEPDYGRGLSAILLTD